MKNVTNKSTSEIIFFCWGRVLFGGRQLTSRTIDANNLSFVVACRHRRRYRPGAAAVVVPCWHLANVFDLYADVLGPRLYYYYYYYYCRRPIQQHNDWQIGRRTDQLRGAGEPGRRAGGRQEKAFDFFVVIVLSSSSAMEVETEAAAATLIRGQLLFDRSTKERIGRRLYNE